MEVLEFEDGCTYTMRFVNLDLTVGSCQTEHQFHVGDAQISYHMMLEDPGFIVT